METEFWNQLFELEALLIRSINSIWNELSTPTYIHLTRKHLRELERRLIAESPYIAKIQSTLRVIDACRERFEYSHNFDLASEGCLFIQYWTDKLYEMINKNITQLNFRSAVSASFNSSRARFKSVSGKIINDSRKFIDILALSNVSWASLVKFKSITNSMLESLNTCSCLDWRPVIEKILSAKNIKQIRKILPEIKFLINEQNEIAQKIRLSYLAKVKLFFKSVRKRCISKKNVNSKVKNQTDNELHKLTEITSSLSSIIAELKVSLNSKFIARRKVSLSFNWKYFRKKKKKTWYSHCTSQNLVSEIDPRTNNQRFCSSSQLKSPTFHQFAINDQPNNN